MSAKDQSRIWLATRKGIFSVEPKNGRWQIATASFLGDNASLLLPDPRDRSIYVALGHGHFGVKMHRSTDLGKSWSPIAAPKYPEYPAGREPEVQRHVRQADPWNTELIWSIEPGGHDQPGTLWAGTVPGGLFRSDDHGSSWQISSTLWEHPTRKTWFGGGLDYPGIHSICVHPKNSNHVTIGISTAGVWHTPDGGKSWELRGKGLRAEYMPPDQQYEPSSRTQSIGRLPRQIPMPCGSNTTTESLHPAIGGSNWREIKDVSPSTFGFAVVVHPRDGKTAWFVPEIKDEKRIPRDGKVVVTRTRDGGKSFETLHRGLPQDHAYDIVFRHCLDIDPTGNKLVMASTTGSVWISEDQGDSWQTLSAHLPPVYCARFEQ